MKPTSADLLIELGTEELPPNALRKLSNAFSTAVVDGLREARLGSGAHHSYATPRRLAVLIEAVEFVQPNQEVTQKGPPTRIAFDAAGAATKAGLAFAKKCGVALEVLTRDTSGKEEVLVHMATQVGLTAATILPDIVRAALESLPIPRRMRWGAYDSEFVRPAHWLIMLHGNDIVPGNVLNVESGRTTRGHRFQSTGAIEIGSPADYCETLKSEGFVLADLDERRNVVVAGVKAAALAAGGEAVGDAALFDEVAALTEWPVPVTGTFDNAFLSLPKEVIIETLTRHQRYFPVQDEAGKLLPVFITLANIESKEPERVRDGNERVILPRLADAVFFWETDLQTPLGTRSDSLKKVVYQKGLGTLYDKSVRVAKIAASLAEECGLSRDGVTRAATLAKCDLVTGMVGEFPELQGVMGRYYAIAAEEADEVSLAIGEQYLPRFSGDRLPDSLTGQLLAVADRLDTLAGIFLIGKKPTGNRDPFGLRRAALGVVRILVEKQIDVNFTAVVALAAAEQPVSEANTQEHQTALYEYIIERMRGYFVDEKNFSSDTFEAVRVRGPESLLDFQARLEAVADFLTLDAAVSLAAANKRTANILRKAKMSAPEQAATVNEALLEDAAEKDLYTALQSAQQDVEPLLARRAYAESLRRLAELRGPIDAFFDGVMVMAEDDALKQNRLGLLVGLRALFLGVADISRLTPAQD